MGDKPTKAYSDIPGTYIFDGTQSRAGYQLNMFCMSLNVESNRDRFRADPEGYLDTFKLTTEQRTAVLERKWLRMLELGGNIYYTFKLAIFDGLTMQHVGGKMSNITVDEFAEMMINGGRSIEGSRYTNEWRDR